MRGIKKQLDERELLLRGNVFKHALFALGAMVFMEIMLAAMDIIWAPPMEGSLLMLAISVVVLSGEMIIKGIYPLSRGRQLAMTVVLGLAGVMLLILSALEIADGAPMLEGSGLSGSSTGILIGLVFIVPILLMGLYSARDRREEKE